MEWGKDDLVLCQHQSRVWGDSVMEILKIEVARTVERFMTLPSIIGI